MGCGRIFRSVLRDRPLLKIPSVGMINMHPAPLFRVRQQIMRAAGGEVPVEKRLADCRRNPAPVHWMVGTSIRAVLSGGAAFR